MRICHLSWEYPPVVYGGLGQHVFAVATEQARAGHDVVVISHVGIDVDDATASMVDEVVDGVRVIRVVRDAPYVAFDAETLLGWVAGLASAMARRGIELARGWKPDVIHAHDWLTAHAASELREVFGAPWIHTIHATEAGRHQGWLPGSLSRSIHSIEGWSARSADRVLVCSKHMQWEVDRLFSVSDAVVVPNGISAAAALVDAELRESMSQTFRTPLIVHTGRLEWEKGAHTLIEAMPRIRRTFPDAECVIAGRGSQEQSLRDLARRKRVASRVRFAGWLPDRELRALVAGADVAVVPSIYEPFGIVALEAAVVGTPVVAARAGGLTEFLAEDRHGWSFEAGDSRGLADAVCSSLADTRESARRTKAARSHVLDEHGWPSITQRVIAEYTTAASKGNGRVDGNADPLPNTEGNLLFDVQ
ncbi:glycosyltransferase family 4 protein [Candidatus Nanopelagicales bacterium]|nr:glycosyltransferase family 4 protein [Candidatus Nanopelagicales bacterium]